MLLEQFTDEEGKISSFYDSSNVLASKYDPKLKKLVVIFGKGNHYLYENVSQHSFDIFQKANSQGNAIHTMIKEHHTTSLGPIDITDIKEDISNFKNRKK